VITHTIRVRFVFEWSSVVAGDKKMGTQFNLKELQEEVSTPQTSAGDSPLVLKTNERRRIVQKSPHLILAIEKTLVACVHEQPLVDDRVVARAGSCAIQQTFDETETVSFVMARLALTATELEVVDQEWCDALRVVLAKIRNQSDLETGEYTYLIYTSALIANEAK